MRRRRLDLDDAPDRVLDLVHLVAVPAGDQSFAFVEVAPAERPAAAAQFDDPSAAFGRFG